MLSGEVVEEREDHSYINLDLQGRSLASFDVIWVARHDHVMAGGGIPVYNRSIVGAGWKPL